MKAQGAMEFVLIFMILFIALSIGTWMSFQKSAEIDRAMLEIETERILNDITGKINIALLEGPGFSVKATLPERIMGLDYSVMNQENAIVIELENNLIYSKGILTQNVTGSFVKGTNIIENSDVTIVITS
jgi:hypothetical protein